MTAPSLSSRIVLLPSLAVLVLGLAAACGSEPGPTALAPTSSARLYEGALFIAGDDRNPIADSAFLVDDGLIMAIGRRGELGLPRGAASVDLTGKTVMPMIVSSHGHVGYQRGLSYEAENYTRANLIDHLNRYAYYGVGTILSLGTDAGSIAFEIRSDQARGVLGGARLLTAGRGLAAPNAGPGAAALRDSVYDVSTEETARDSVRKLAALDVDVVKIWVDNRNGTVEKLRPELYRAIIDEAHGRNLQVIAHVYYAADAADLVAAGVDGFAHLIRDQEMTSQLVGAISSGDVFVMPNLGISERGTHFEPPAWLDDPLLLHSVSPDVITRAKEAFGGRTEDEVARSRASYARMQRSVARLVAAGVPLVLGADSGVQDRFFGYTELRELELMVEAGLTPGQAIEAATSRPDGLLGLDDVGLLTAGRRADFIVLNASPLEDISNIRSIDDVFMKGVRLDREAMRAGWAGP
jgi:imidazolonepropionase-like amidohydrolase